MRHSKLAHFTLKILGDPRERAEIQNSSFWRPEEKEYKSHSTRPNIKLYVFVVLYFTCDFPGTLKHGKRNSLQRKIFCVFAMLYFLQIIFK